MEKHKLEIEILKTFSSPPNSESRNKFFSGRTLTDLERIGTVIYMLQRSGFIKTVVSDNIPGYAALTAEGIAYLNEKVGENVRNIFS